MSALTVSHTLTRLHARQTAVARPRVSPRRAAGVLVPLGAALGVSILLAGLSLGLANLTLSFQEERAQLRLEIKEARNGLDAFNAALAERQDPAALKTAAEALGLVPEGALVFVDATAEHITRQ